MRAQAPTCPWLCVGDGAHVSSAGQNLTLGVFLDHSPFYILRLIFNPELMDTAVVASQLALGPLSPSPEHWDYRQVAPPSIFM